MNDQQASKKPERPVRLFCSGFIPWVGDAYVLIVTEKMLDMGFRAEAHVFWTGPRAPTDVQESAINYEAGLLKEKFEGFVALTPDAAVEDRVGVAKGLIMCRVCDMYQTQELGAHYPDVQLVEGPLTLLISLWANNRISQATVEQIRQASQSERLRRALQKLMQVERVEQ